MAESVVIGWDIGGAHVKACLTHAGRVREVRQWPCPLWLGLDRLAAVLHAAATHWSGLPLARHAVTMTGEMADLFAHREDGVLRIAALLLQHLPADRVRFFAGDAGWCGAAGVARHWPTIASANWLATARHVAALHRGEGVLIDIGSSTTDLIAFGHGRVLTAARSDAERLASSELVYQGVVRTPLCALAQRIGFGGVQRNVMNELFATSADVYRLTGELAAEHDQQPSADHAGKDLPATQQRLARMIGLDAHDASAADWLAFAHAWRAQQLAEWRVQLQRVLAAHGLSAGAVSVSAGCGDFVVPGLRSARCVRYADLLPAAPAAQAANIQLGAPAVAVALLLEQEEPETR